jgi:DamX protein
LLSQPAEAFTLQLLGVSQKSSVNRFLREHQFSQPVAYFHTFRDSKDWYVLVYGVYVDRAAAKAAIASLPEPVRKAGPWSRSFSSIQADIQSGYSP